MNHSEDKLALFEFYPAKKDPIGLISIPHSGVNLIKDLENCLTSDLRAINEDVDTWVHLLIDIPYLQQQGISIIKANYIRTCIDLNRSREEAFLNWQHNSKGIRIVSNKPSLDIENKILALYYDPYFTVLQNTKDQIASYQKPVKFVDLHSMPSRATDYHLKINPGQSPKRPDFCISDLKGISCTPHFINKISESLASHGYHVLQNNPYFGGHITKWFNSLKQTENIQIEISRALYMDENSKDLNTAPANKLKNHLTESLIELFQ